MAPPTHGEHDCLPACAGPHAQVNSAHSCDTQPLSIANAHSPIRLARGDSSKIREKGSAVLGRTAVDNPVVAKGAALDESAGNDRGVDRGRAPRQLGQGDLDLHEGDAVAAEGCACDDHSNAW